jgi:hypothetical protein
MAHQSSSSCLRSCLRRFILIVLGLAGGAILLFCGIILWWGFVYCAPGRTPAPYPNTILTERVNQQTAVIKSETRTITYTTQVPIERLIEHYDSEMRWTCQSGSIEALAPAIPSSEFPIRYHAQCWIKGWKSGGYTFYPEGGYSFGTIQQVEIDATVYRDGTIEVRHIEDFAEGC